MNLQKQSQSKKNDVAVKQVVIPKGTKEQITVDEAFNFLDRIIGFINNCDNKASIVLGGTVAILAIIFSNESVKNIANIMKTGNLGAGKVIYLIFILLSLIVLFVGLIYLILVIVARIKANENSIIYFERISKFKDATEYKKNILSSSHDDLLEDILNQIYINSTICSQKYKYYNNGLKYIMIGFGVLIIVLVIGIFWS